ncbi:MAG: hypothetical protein ABI461_20700 [Polyangiaceae bacterium]
MASSAKKKKGNALASAASRKLAQIGGPKMTPEQLAHSMMHAEADGQAERLPLDDGSWAWRVTFPDGTTRMLKPTPEILAALARFEREGHPAH